MLARGATALSALAPLSYAARSLAPTLTRCLAQASAAAAARSREVSAHFRHGRPALLVAPAGRRAVMPACKRVRGAISGPAHRALWADLLPPPPQPPGVRPCTGGFP